MTENQIFSTLRPKNFRQPLEDAPWQLQPLGSVESPSSAFIVTLGIGLDNVVDEDSCSSAPVIDHTGMI